MVTKDQILAAVKTPEFVAGVGTFASFYAGGLLSVLLLRKELEAKYAAIADKEIAEAKKFYTRLYKDDKELSDPEELSKSKGYTVKEEVTGINAVIEGLRYRTVHPDLEPIIDDGSEESAELIEAGEKLAKVLDHAEETRNLFEGTGDFDYDVEVSMRKPQFPYIITHEEFLENEPEHKQIAITYFEGDGVLSDDRDQSIEELDRTVGDGNIIRFGAGSNDPNILYIRNERLKMDFEIARSDGKYAHEVLGLEHSDETFDRRRRARRFRGDDE